MRCQSLPRLCGCGVDLTDAAAISCLPVSFNSLWACGSIQDRVRATWCAAVLDSDLKIEAAAQKLAGLAKQAEVGVSDAVKHIQGIKDAVKSRGDTKLIKSLRKSRRDIEVSCHTCSPLPHAHSRHRARTSASPHPLVSASQEYQEVLTKAIASAEDAVSGSKVCAVGWRQKTPRLSPRGLGW